MDMKNSLEQNSCSKCEHVKEVDYMMVPGFWVLCGLLFADVLNFWKKNTHPPNCPLIEKKS